MSPTRQVRSSRKLQGGTHIVETPFRCRSGWTVGGLLASPPWGNLMFPSITLLCRPPVLFSTFSGMTRQGGVKCPQDSAPLLDQSGSRQDTGATPAI